MRTIPMSPKEKEQEKKQAKEPQSPKTKQKTQSHHSHLPPIMNAVKLGENQDPRSHSKS